MHITHITLTLATVAFVAWMAVVAPRWSALPYQSVGAVAAMDR